MMQKLNGRVAVAASAVGVLVVVLVGWFGLVSPQRSKATSLDGQIATAQTQLASDSALLASSKHGRSLAALRAAEIALPATPQMSAILRQLSTLVARSKTELDTITPATPVPASGAEALPIALSVKGRYFALRNLVRLLRQSAGVSGNRITGHGRLYSITNVQFAQAGGTTSSAGAGLVSATINLNAYVFSTVPAPAPAQPAASTTDSSTTSSDSTASTVTP